MDRIEIDPEICSGRPVIKGTRITVQTILGFLSAGDSIDDIRAGYPHLTREDVLACLESQLGPFPEACFATSFCDSSSPEARRVGLA